MHSIFRQLTVKLIKQYVVNAILVQAFYTLSSTYTGVFNTSTCIVEIAWQLCEAITDLYVKMGYMQFNWDGVVSFVNFSVLTWSKFVLWALLKQFVLWAVHKSTLSLHSNTDPITNICAYAASSNSIHSELSIPWLRKHVCNTTQFQH
jgi:hypothetical protein